MDCNRFIRCDHTLEGGVSTDFKLVVVHRAREASAVWAGTRAPDATEGEARNANAEKGRLATSESRRGQPTSPERMLMGASVPINECGSNGSANRWVTRLASKGWRYSAARLPSGHRAAWLSTKTPTSSEATLFAFSIRSSSSESRSDKSRRVHARVECYCSLPISPSASAFGRVRIPVVLCEQLCQSLYKPLSTYRRPRSQARPVPLGKLTTFFWKFARFLLFWGPR